MGDWLLRLGVERLFEILGEALNRATKSESEAVSVLTFGRAVINMRNLISHGYDEISDRIVWATAVDDIPKMREEIRQLLEHSGYRPY